VTSAGLLLLLVSLLSTAGIIWQKSAKVGRNGSVSRSLKVHGTANLRVADASVISVPLAAHIQSMVYTIGERAADMIKFERK